MLDSRRALVGLNSFVTESGFETCFGWDPGTVGTISAKHTSRHLSHDLGKAHISVPDVCASLIVCNVCLGDLDHLALVHQHRLVVVRKRVLPNLKKK